MYSEEFEDTKGGNQNQSIEEGQMTQWSKKKYKRTNKINKALHRKLKI